jgi:NAD(P)-dependent dehydrogenase (short-subunit alcohol dehydrogenase family)
MSTVLITGATSGLGAALAEQCLARGDRVIACGRNAEALAALRERHGEQVETRQFDIADRAAVAVALATIPEIDIVILNAGTCEYVDVDRFDAAMVERVFAANFLGAVYCTEALLPRLSAGSQLVYVDSLARLLPFTRSQAYGASKAALHYFARTMEVDLAARGIRVHSVSPGFIDTPLTRKNTFAMPMLISPEQAAAGILRGIARGRRNIYVPWGFAAMLRVLGALPECMQVWLASKMKGSQ